MFNVTTEGMVSVTREPSGYGMLYDLVLEEYEGDPTTIVEIWFLLGRTRLHRQAARQILAERGVSVVGEA